MDCGQITYLNYLEGDLDSGQSIIFHEDETRELRTTVDGVTLAQTERGSVPLCSECRPRWEVWRDTTGGTWSDWRRRWTA